MQPIAADGVEWSVGLVVRLSVMTVSPTKTAEPIEMPFGTWIGMGSKNHAFDGDSDPHMGRGDFEGERSRRKTCPAVDILKATYQGGRITGTARMTIVMY